MKYKLLCIDMDGTLLDPKGKISNENREAIKKAYEKNIKIAIATGRRFLSAEQYLELLGVEGMIIALNGSYIKEKGSKESIFQCPLSKEEIRQIYKVVANSGIKTNFNTVDELITYQKKADMFPTQEEWLNMLEKLAGEILKVSIISESDTESFFEVRKKLEALGSLEVVPSEVNYVDIMKKGCSKGSAVKMLAEILEIKREEIVCIGDHENDISMINYAGMGVAMGNGRELVKQAADYVTDTNKNSGVAKAIYKILLGCR